MLGRVDVKARKSPCEGIGVYLDARDSPCEC